MGATGVDRLGTALVTSGTSFQFCMFLALLRGGPDCAGVELRGGPVPVGGGGTMPPPYAGWACA